MFKAVRDSMIGFGHRIGAAWQDMRAKGMVRLFLFEFAVVVLGVLVAQALQAWSKERDAQAEMFAAKAAMEEQLSRSYATAVVWKRALPCLEARVIEIGRMASRGETLPSALAVRPVLYSRDLAPFSEDSALRLSRTIGPDLYENYEAGIQHTNSINDVGGAIAREWVQFSRIDPEFGEVREGDILAARDAAAKIRSSLRTLAISANAIEVAAKALDLEVGQEVFDGQKVLPLDDCTQLDRLQSIYRLE